MTGLLRLATAGSVDDGKSTLIGRLLHDTKAILADQYADLEGVDGELDLARLTDGLRAEREQGITIDVAYRHFATPARRFVLADTPGHLQYTRNMVTGASTADAAVVLLDARRGIAEQTKRHAFISALLGIPHIVVAVNKMDLVGYSQERFEEIVADFGPFRRRLAADPHRPTPSVRFIPISALRGDNVVAPSPRMPWYRGPTLLGHLEAIDPAQARNLDDLRFPVQLVIGDDGDAAYAGQVASGVLRAGDRVRVLPSGAEATVARIETFEGELAEAAAPRSVTVRLADAPHVGRGDVLVAAGDDAPARSEVAADVCWFSPRPLQPGDRMLVKHLTSTVEAVVEEIDDVVDAHTLARVPPRGPLRLNDIGRVRLRAGRPLVADPYAANRATGAFLLIDPQTNDTVAGGMIAA
jgi:sulfate adenylyltransferase large subunit